VTLAASYLRATARRTIVLCAGLGAAALAFAMVAVTLSAPIVRIGAGLPPGSPRPLYDVLVEAAGRGTSTGDVAAAGGISLAQYGIIRRLPGVEVAAPMTMIGYVPVKVTFPVAVPTAAVASPPKLLTVTAVYRGNGYPGTVGERNPGRAYVTADPLLLNSGRGALGAGDVAASAVIRPSACPGQPAPSRQPVVYIAVEQPTPCWSPRAASGPHAGAGAPRSAVSVSLGWTFMLPLVAVDPAAEARLTHLDKALIEGRYLPATTAAPLAPVPMIVTSSLDDKDEAWLGVTLPTGRTIGAVTVTAATAFSLLVGHIRGASLAVPAYWTNSGQYPAGGPLLRHAARPSGAGPGSGASLAAIGVFNPAKVAGSPAGYPSLATLVMPLQDVGAFTGARAYAGSDPGSPIGTIRVVVAGVTGDDTLSLARVRAVAQEIVRATGLRVDVSVATAATVAVGLDPGRVELAILMLLPGVTFFGNGVGATLHGRRRDLLTLRALGWRRGRIMRQLLLEFALIAAGGWMLAAALAGAIEAGSPARPAPWWPVLAAGAAVALTIAAIWWPVRRATGQSPGRARSRTAFGVVMLALGCAAVGQELAARWIFHGMIVGSVLGRAVVWQSGPADLAAAVIILAVTTLAVADVHWLNTGQRAPELRTLHAIGWPARNVVRLVLVDAVVVGALGGLAGGTVDLAGALAVTQHVPAGMLLASAAVFGLGVVISLVALGLAALARPAA
jgi:hypothetical protein